MYHGESIEAFCTCPTALRIPFYSLITRADKSLPDQKRSEIIRDRALVMWKLERNNRLSRIQWNSIAFLSYTDQRRKTFDDRSRSDTRSLVKKGRRRKGKGGKELGSKIRPAQLFTRKRNSVHEFTCFEFRFDMESRVVLSSFI